MFVDLLASEEAYLLLIDLPGATRQTASVRTTDGRLRVEADRPSPVRDEEAFTPVRTEREPTLSLELPLPPDATGEGATATLERGVLELRLPREAAGTGTAIPIEDA